jgi:hypothetical protein
MWGNGVKNVLNWVKNVKNGVNSMKNEQLSMNNAVVRYLIVLFHALIDYIAHFSLLIVH